MKAPLETNSKTVTFRFFCVGTPEYKLSEVLETLRKVAK